MVILKLNYEYREIRLGRVLWWTMLATLLVGGAASRVPAIPDSFSLALGIPVGMLTALIWELFISDSNKVFEKGGVAWLLTKIKEGDEGTVKEFSNKYIKVMRRSRMVLPLVERSVLEEVLLIVHFVRSSFMEEIVQEEAQRVQELWESIQKKGSSLEKDFGISLNNLCWLYYSNNCYRYHYHGQGTSVPFELKLKNRDLQVQKWLSDTLLSREGFYVKEGTYKGHELMERYRMLSKTILYNFADSSAEVCISNEAVQEIGTWLIQLFKEIKHRQEFQVMTFQVAWDLICLLSFSKDRQINIDRWLEREGLPEIEKVEASLFAYFHTHPVLDFLVKSRTDFRYFKQYAGSYAFSEQCRNTFIGHIYKNELMRALGAWEEKQFVAVYEEKKSVLGSSWRITNFDRLIERFYLKFKYEQPLRFEDIAFDYVHLDKGLREVDRAFYKKRQKLLSDMVVMEERDEKMQVVKWVFRPYYCLTWFKTTPIYIFQPFQKFSEYLMDEN